MKSQKLAQKDKKKDQRKERIDTSGIDSFVSFLPLLPFRRDNWKKIYETPHSHTKKRIFPYSLVFPSRSPHNG